MRMIVVWGVLLWGVLQGGYAQSTVPISAQQIQQLDTRNDYSVLVYHDIVDASVANARALDKSTYYPQTIELGTLIQHFNWLRTNGYHPVSWQQIEDARAGGAPLPPKAVLLAFDDGYESFYRLVYPMLKRYEFPAVLAVVTSWMDAGAQQKIPYGEQFITRERMMNWAQLREMRQSGWVEIASHTHNLHRSVVANPHGTQQAAAIAPEYSKWRYETEAEYRQRLEADLRTSYQLIRSKTGVAPRVLVWPYGQFNGVAAQAARAAGFSSHHSLDNKANRVTDAHVGRLLLDQETSVSGISDYLRNERWQSDVQRVVQVDLDAIYDLDTVQQNKNIDALIERIYRYRISTVYLQAFADDNGDGVAEALYFPNSHMRLKSDLFSRVAWQLYSRAGVKVYAWMPMMAFDLGKEAKYVTDARTGAPATDQYRRLSIDDASNRAKIRAIYRSLSLYAKFNGVLFHDDGFLTDFEGKIAPEPRTDEQKRSEAQAKTQQLIDWSHELRDTVAQYQLGAHTQTARNLYARVITDAAAQDWFAQDLATFSKNYDYTAVMAMPYMELGNDTSPALARQWVHDLVRSTAKQAPLSRVVFELQSKKWYKTYAHQSIDTHELLDWMQLLSRNGVVHMGYYPDDATKNQPDSRVLHPYFSLQNSAVLP